MIVPFNVRDFLDRAEVAYPDRIGLIDEPDQPGEAWGPLSFADLAARARAQALGLDRLGIGRGERVAVVSHNSSRLLTSFYGVCGWGRILVPVNFRLAPAEVEYIVEHSGAS
ncbi:MAG TPA: AMP-binding protein, partial [Acidimicrobiales bacterium]|nr:AMP-binding protein [Acidimicrobiales bacterium]